jgi:hypothetical protein
VRSVSRVDPRYPGPEISEFIRIKGFFFENA